MKELKDIEPSYVFQILYKMSPFLEEISLKGSSSSMVEEAELNFSIKLLKSPYLQQKIKGINHLKDFIERLDLSYDYLK
jgi:hypothetical protein